MSPAIVSGTLERASNEATAHRRRTHTWLFRGALAILDEGTVAGSNFLVGILLARWLSPNQYGAYALAYSIFLVLAAFYRALILEPISVFGPAFRKSGRSRYLGKLLQIQLVMVLPVMLVLAASSALLYFWGEQSVAWALTGLVLAAPCLLIFSFTRFCFYLDFKPGGAFSGALVYLILIAGGIILLNRRGLLSPFTTFLLMSVGAFLSGTIQLGRLKPALRQKFVDDTLTDVWKKHWSYGRWSLPTAILTWLPANIFYFLAGSLWGIAQTGALKALTNFIVPLGHLTAAFSLLLTPYVSRLYDHEGVAGTKSLVQRINTLYFAAGAAYCVLIVVFRAPLFHVLYGHRYDKFIWLVPLAGIVAALNMAGSGSRIALRAIQSPSSLFVAYLVAGAASVVFGLPLVWICGVPGALVASIISSSVMFLSVVLLFRRKVSNSPRYRFRTADLP